MIRAQQDQVAQGESTRKGHRMRGQQACCCPILARLLLCSFRYRECQCPRVSPACGWAEEETREGSGLQACHCERRAVNCTAPGVQKLLSEFCMAQWCMAVGFP